jgi:2-keto-3-deoxy-L-rhamnonate aldolase RhmA
MTTLRDKLQNDQVALGLAITLPAPGIIDAIGAGWDWVWTDAQHGQMSYETMLHLIRAADLRGLASIPRVPGHAYDTIGPVMDMRPAGIMVPMVDTPAQARQVVDAARFPPLGKRSFGGRRMIDLEGRDYFRSANQDTLLLAQIETPEAVGNASAIAAIEGVDVLFFGADDVKVRLGIPINTPAADSPEVVRAMERTARAARDAGKSAGCVATNSATLALAVSLGYRLIAGGQDVLFLREGSNAKLQELHHTLDARKA